MFGLSTAENRDEAGEPTHKAEGELVLVADNRPPVEPNQSDASRSQRRGIGAWLRIFAVVVDAVAISAIPLVWVALYSPELSEVEQRSYIKLAALYSVIALLLVIPTQRRLRVATRPSQVFGSIVVRVGFAQMLAASLTWWATRVETALWAKITLATVAVLWIGRLISFKLTHSARERGFDLEDTLLVGTGSVGVDVAEAMLRNPECGLIPVAFVDRCQSDGPLPVIGRPEDLEVILEESQIRHVILGYGLATDAEIVAIVRKCSHLPVQFYAIPRFFELGIPTDRRGFEVDGFALSPIGKPGHYHAMWPLKRAFDLAVSSVLLVLTAPLMAFCALAVKLTSPGPVLFKQERVSTDNIPFDILKFRTMKFVADPELQAKLDQKAQAVNLDDDRITSIGKFLRKSHLDELPQLWNVFCGEMSIVGPRPERPFFVDLHSDEIDGYQHRHRVPAGITGWAQVNGYWGDSSLEARVRLDNRYIESWTPVKDLVIGLRTIPTLLGKRR
ncbi:MAG TPA: hypothetical protein DEG43_01625 [Acidimicrobiaceae bacterium]|jgi:exopolysaccharide biosynthesis polyprenyl glycosylphosphotransferase|nr:hypothetical protein [Acidimicrobiaceae bacterium]